MHLRFEGLMVPLLGPVSTHLLPNLEVVDQENGRISEHVDKRWNNYKYPGNRLKLAQPSTDHNTLI